MEGFESNQRTISGAIQASPDFSPVVEIFLTQRHFAFFHCCEAGFVCK